MDKMKIISSESKGKLGRSGKGLITSLGFKAKVRPHKYQKAWFSIKNVSKKNLSKIIREFERLPCESYEKQRPKHEPTDSYFYLVRQLAKFTMRADALNLHIYPVRMEMTTLSRSRPRWDNLPSRHQGNPLLGLFGKVQVLGSKILF